MENQAAFCQLLVNFERAELCLENTSNQEKLVEKKTLLKTLSYNLHNHCLKWHFARGVSPKQKGCKIKPYQVCKIWSTAPHELPATNSTHPLFSFLIHSKTNITLYIVPENAAKQIYYLLLKRVDYSYSET